MLTTHCMEEAERLAHRVAMIAGGGIVAEGPPERLGRRTESLGDSLARVGLAPQTPLAGAP